MKLHDYQLRAAEWLRGNPSAILAVEMGLGKTATVLHYIAATAPATCLIVAPKRVAETVWLQEAAKWGLAIADRMVVVAGTPAKRRKALADTSRPYKIIGRDNLADIKGWRTDLLILDELTSFKTITSQRSKAIASVTAAQKIGLTGTFLANGAIDIFGQAAAVGLSRHLGRNFYSWRAEYFRDIMQGSGYQFSIWQTVRPLEEILRPIKPAIFTLTAADYLTIPPVTETEHPVELTAEEREAYDGIDAFLAGTIGGEVVTADDKAKFVKLQTACDGFVYVDDEDGRRAVGFEIRSKAAEVVEFCRRAAAEGEQVLLFYAFVEERDHLIEQLNAAKVPATDVKSAGALDKWAKGEAGVLLAHPASAGHGLNLQGGGRLIAWSSVTYNYEYFAQANARLARQGQTKPVEIHYFTARNTCEERVRRALSRKAAEQGLFTNLTK